MDKEYALIFLLLHCDVIDIFLQVITIFCKFWLIACAFTWTPTSTG